MKKIMFGFLLSALFFVTLNAASLERSARNYQARYCKELSIAKLQEQLKDSRAENKKLISEGSESCKNAGETFNTMKAERKGRQLFDHCESYRYGDIRKTIHKNKVIIRASESELKERKK